MQGGSSIHARLSRLLISSARCACLDLAVCSGHSRPVPDLAFTNDTADGYFLVSACLDNKAMLRDGQTGDWIGTFVGHKGAVWCARLNAAATQAATAAADFSVKLWDALSGAELHTLQHKHIVKSVCFSSDNTRLYSGGAEKKLRIFDLARPDAAGQELTDHSQTISQVLTTQDENLIVTGAAEKDIRIWDRRTGAVAQRLSTSGDVRYAQTTLDGSVLSVSTGGKEVSFYNTSNMQLIKTFTMPREIDCLSYDPVHQRFITVGATAAEAMDEDLPRSGQALTVCCVCFSVRSRAA